MKTRANPEPGITAPRAPVVERDGVYLLGQLKTLLGLSKTTLVREARLGRLRVSRRAGKYFTLGSWVLRWIEDGPGAKYRAADRAAGAAKGDNP
jgi:hypothetical protein